MVTTETNQRCEMEVRKTNREGNDADDIVNDNLNSARTQLN
jgi:hypothetical protein